jgi:CRISPR/Cas system endoribonuclease Cas6 (RAMP superfamily)
LRKKKKIRKKLKHFDVYHTLTNLQVRVKEHILAKDNELALLTDNEHMTERFTFIALYQKRESNKNLILIIENSMLIK